MKYFRQLFSSIKKKKLPVFKDRNESGQPLAGSNYDDTADPFSDSAESQPLDDPAQIHKSPTSTIADQAGMAKYQTAPIMTGQPSIKKATTATATAATTAAATAATAATTAAATATTVSAVQNIPTPQETDEEKQKRLAEEEERKRNNGGSQNTTHTEVKFDWSPLGASAAEISFLITASLIVTNGALFALMLLGIKYWNTTENVTKTEGGNGQADNAQQTAAFKQLLEQQEAQRKAQEAQQKANGSGAATATAVPNSGTTTDSSSATAPANNGASSDATYTEKPNAQPRPYAQTPSATAATANSTDATSGTPGLTGN
jgi:hypothetical protein